MKLKPNLSHQSEFEGFSEYNPLYFKTPKVEYHVSGKLGYLKIKTKSISHDDENFSFDWDKSHFRNKSEFKFPLSVPTKMRLEFGMGEAEIDLTGMQIKSLDLECGMGSVTLNVKSMNPIECEELDIETGMGEFEGVGMGYIRAETVNIDVGLGSATLDFSDKIIEDMNIEVNVGLGSIDIILPTDANISVQVDDHFLSSVNVEDLVKKGNKYFSPIWRNERPTITLDMSVGLGSIDLELED